MSDWSHSGYSRAAPCAPASPFTWLLHTSCPEPPATPPFPPAPTPRPCAPALVLQPVLAEEREAAEQMYAPQQPLAGLGLPPQMDVLSALAGAVHADVTGGVLSGVCSRHAMEHGTTRAHTNTCMWAPTRTRMHTHSVRSLVRAVCFALQLGVHDLPVLHVSQSACAQVACVSGVGLPAIQSRRCGCGTAPPLSPRRFGGRWRRRRRWWRRLCRADGRQDD